MAQRQFVIASSPLLCRKQVPVRVHVTVDDHTPIGPWVATLAARFGYPLVDPFGAPIPYRLRQMAGEYVVPMTAHLAEARVPSGSCFVLEPEPSQTIPIQKEYPAHAHSSSLLRLSRRSLLGGSILIASSLLGFGSGMTTAFAQRLLRHQNAMHPATPTVPAPVALTIRTMFTQHQQTVQAVSWAPDESAIASGGNDHLALLWNLDGTVLQTLPLTASVRALAWSPDGRQIVVGSATTVSFFDAHTGATLAENAEQHTAPITALGWTGAQTTPLLALSASADTRAIGWNGQTHQPQVVFQQHTTPIEALTVLAETVATASQGGIVRVWNAFSGQETHGCYSDAPHPFRAIAFSSMGALAIGNDEGMISFWHDGRTCMQQQQDVFGMHCLDTPQLVQGHRRPVRAITFSPHGTLFATGGDDGQLIIWSVSTMTPLLQHVQQDAIVALAWSPSGQFLAAAQGTRITLWHVHQ